MPIIDIYSPLEIPPDGLLQTIAKKVSSYLDIPPDYVWAFWHAVKPQCYSRANWLNQPGLAGPIVKIRCKSSYSSEQAEKLITITGQLLSDVLRIPYDTVFIILDRVLPGQLLARGEIWRDMYPENVSLRTLGIVRNERNDLSDDNWENIVSEIALEKNWLEGSALDGIEGFSHLEIIFFMHRVDPEKIPLGSRHPRNIEHLPKVGILAQRPKARPNRLGLSRCEFLGRTGFTLKVKGLDAVNGTPVLDVKPYYEEFGPRGRLFEPDWVHELLKHYY